MKQCSACLLILPLEVFSKDQMRADGYCSRCKDCYKERRPSVRLRAKCKRCGAPASVRSGYCIDHRVAAYRKNTQNCSTRRYEKTVNGFLMRVYRNMKSRVTGIQHKKAHLYLALSLLDKNEFYTWSLNDAEFWRLFQDWVANNYSRLLTPSIDRIDSNRGYEKGNIRWLTHSQNSSLGAISKLRKAS